MDRLLKGEQFPLMRLGLTLTTVEVEIEEEAEMEEEREISFAYDIILAFYNTLFISLVIF